MSFVNLATLTTHRRNEMISRINNLHFECDQSIILIQRLKLKAQQLVQQLNCDPTELRDKFLQCMQQLDEYTYIITEFNLSIGNNENLGSSDNTPTHPVHDISTILRPTEVQKPNLLDILSEPTSSTSTACWNMIPCHQVYTDKSRRKIPKDQQTLIQFSSGSCSSESVQAISKGVSLEKEVQCNVVSEINALTIDDSYSHSVDNDIPATCIPAQSTLQADQCYSAVIISVDVPNFWAIVDSWEKACSLMTEMTDYYKNRPNNWNMEDTSSLTYCAYYDEESETYYRGLLIRLNEEDVEVAEVFLVDTGELRAARAGGTQPLAARFAQDPPYARCCHLAGIDLLKCHNKDLMEKQEQFMKNYVGALIEIEVDDNTSESLGVYVKLDGKDTLNDLLVKEGLALAIEVDKPAETSRQQASSVVQARPEVVRRVTGPPEMRDDEIDITEGPEYEDPVEAVTGYHSRDDEEICHFYKGGPEKTCFKGARCKKRHVMKHPEGWTLDRVEVLTKLPSRPLPAVDTWHRVLVTNVCHYNRLFVHFVTPKLHDPPRDFGVILPPTTLDSLVRDMNSPATRQAYKPLTMTPAPGEIVAAVYPPDEQWYRAQVISATRSDQNVEVRYVDYGNVVWVKEDQVRMLEPRWAVLAVQATCCVLAGVRALGGSAQWKRAKQVLSELLLDKTLDAHIVGRTYDELVVELTDKNGYSVAEQLASRNLVTLHEYQLNDDSDALPTVVVP